MNRTRTVLAGFLLFFVGTSAYAARKAGRLTVAFIDVEGGQATLFVTPTGESLLIDTGWPSNGSRDADRIMRAAKESGINRIDFVLLTHYHVDHAGGVPQLAARIPVGTFIDHGPNREPDTASDEQGSYPAYRQTLATSGARHIVATRGQLLPVPGMRVQVVSADGKVTDDALPGAGQPNPFCAASEVRAADTSENGRSLGVLITFGKLKILDLGDLTWDKEMQLMCPVNELGTVDVLVVSHHGFNQSNSPALVDAVHARVAIMDNGERKGGTVAALKTVNAAPGLETLWQLHTSAAGKTDNTPERFIANPLGTDAGFAIKLLGDADGSFEVVNERTGMAQQYAARR
jgi:beta-lactamase superfamily II metal-dependent hydrolase